jgi:hypothetical protein
VPTREAARSRERCRRVGDRARHDPKRPRRRHDLVRVEARSIGEAGCNDRAAGGDDGPQAAGERFVALQGEEDHRRDA